MAEVDANDGYTVVNGKKRRRGSTSPEHAARQPNKPGEQRSSQQRKRPTGPRAVPPHEIKATRANIAEAKARQATTNHENYVFVELCPEIPDYSYLKAMSALLGGPKNIAQFNRMNGHYVVGLANKDLANRLVANGLEIEGTTLKVFPFRKRAERIVVANLPGFVEDSTIATALGQFGRVTSIAPILVKMGEFTFTDGRREAFILLREGRPRKPAPEPATPASPVQPANTSTEAQAIPSAHQPAEQMDLTHPAPAAHPAPLAALRPPEPRIPPLDHDMSVEKLSSPPATPARGKAALEQLLEHLRKSPNPSIDWDKLPDLNREEAQKLLTSETTMKKRAPTLTEEQFTALDKLHETIKALCPDSNSTIRKTLQKTRKETNAFHLGSGQDLCLGYSAVVLAHPVAISGSGLACVFGPGVAVLQQRILWPGHIALATIEVHGEEMTTIAVHLAHEPRERNRQLKLLAATAAQEEEGACWIIGDFNIRDRGPSSSSSSDALAALLDLAALVDVATQFDAAHLPTRVGPPTTAVSSPTQPRLAAMLRSGLALEHLAGYIRELEEDTAHDDDDGTFWDRWTSIKAGLLAEARSLHDPRHAASDSYVYRARRCIAAQLEASSIRADYPSLPDLARAIRLRRPVSVIRDEEDNVIEGPELRRRAFATFQPRFARPTSDPAAGAAFIASSAPTTTRELSEEDPLHRPDISLSEIANAIEHLPRGKAPGWDGLPCELLVAFNEDFFAEALARVFAASRLRGALPPSTRRSSICFVPKARGGRGLDGYRPVELPSADYRVLAAILHRRLKPHLRTLVPECQSYAVPGRSPSWNIAMVTDAVEEATALGSPLAVMGVDLESAFDSLDRGFLDSLLTSLRLPPAFSAWINILYAGADATIRAGGFYTAAFPLHNSLRKGCAVSAALFSIATGPLLRRLELTLGVGNVTAYADDIVLLFHRDENLERVATVFEYFKQASGVGVNLRKSAGLWCGAWRNRGDSPLGASWSTTSIRILGLDIAPRSTVAHREQHLLALLETACRRWTPFTRGPSLVGRARAANTLVGSTIQHHLHGYLPSPPTIAKLQARMASCHRSLGLLDLATQLQLACLKGVQVALRGGRNAFSWLAKSGEAWIHPPPDGTRLQPRRLRLLKLWEEASNILGLNHRAVPTAQLLDLPIIGGCRFLRPPDLLAPARWRGARVRDLTVEEHLIARPTRLALADAAALGAFCRRLTSENAVGFGAESTPSSSSLAAAVVLRGTATPFLNGLTTPSARRALDRPRFAATLISRFLARWTPTINPPPRIDWASLRRCAYSGHEADAALKLAFHALPHPAHPASVGPSCTACGSIDRSLSHRYWCFSSIRPLIREAFNIIGRPPDLQAWIFGGSGLEDDALSILASAKLRIYRYFVQIQPPETFDFSTPNEWPKWRKRFERYLVVSGMKKKEEADKIDLFMYLMGDRADDIFRTFKFEKKEEATKIDSVLKAFDSHFCVRKNIIYERAKFNSRIQEDREPVDEFITSLYKLADSCEFEGLHEQLIRDRMVVGVRDKALSERMQLDSELTLEKAVKMVRQQEAVRQQQVDLQRPSASQKVNQVKFNSKKQSPKQQQQPSRKKEKSAKTRSRCPKCGGFTHREGQACRAEGQRCNLCSKTGHFVNCCPDKQAKTAEVKAVSELDEEIGFLLEVSAVEDSSNLDYDEGECRRRWTAEIQVNGKKVKFKLDSQADVTCVPLCLFKKIMGQQRLVKSDINLRAAEFSELQTVGMFLSTLRNGSYEIKEKIYVIRRLSEPLLSRRACELLNLARRIEVVATRINPIKEFPEVFEGLGQIGNPYEIKLKPGAKPYAVHTPRRVPIPLMEKLRTRLEELEKAGIIAQVNVATEWCAPTVIAGKPNGDIRLCVDLSRLNEHVQREVHPMPVVEHMLGQLGEARFFSKLDANSGFHQIPLSPDYQHLTTFITPFGRYKYCRMPFGISLAPEYFQRVMSIILQGMDGVMCYLDDILIFASDSKTHDRILRLVLRKLKEAKVTLNKAKCVFGVPRINFLGHILDEDGIRPDPAKIEAVAEMPAPTDVHGVRRFLGMVNHLGRFVENLSEIVAPLNQLLVKGQDFVWDCSQERAFRKLKELLTTQPILAAYDVRKPTMVSSDASSYGLGAVLKQEGKNGIWRPVAYSSRTMTPTEKRYAQIEKEALAITWACERFQDFLLGKRFRIETDHKPLIPLFSTKELSSLTPRLQRFRMRMMRFGFEIVHIPGKELLDADALSRQPLLTTEGGENERQTSAHINAVLSSITDKDEMLTKIFEAQQEDTTLKAVVNYLEKGWPDKKKMSQALLSYWHVKDELGVQNGLLMRSCRLVIPAMVQLDRLTANVVVRSCKSIFARHGIPETVVSDNGTQFGAAREFANFARQYGFTHVTSSPRFPQSNGMAEAGVKIAKLILKKNQDPSLGLLEYRSTPLENGYSPAELLMGRKLRTTLPIAPENLNPKLVDSQTLKRKEGRRRKDMKSRYDRRCGATDMEELSEGDTVWITDMRTWGVVKQKASTPRSYLVDTPVGTLRRNRFHLRKGVTVQYPADPSTPTFSGEDLVENEKTPVVDYPSNDSEDGQIRTRSGRIVKPVDRLHY
ncbi:K02A2.6-like [Cordylochernes scorpioides]|uniref:K02A2.6-like n=1 Tax=Cordylochernes scorpioides TaxID=51811 RepID=A0ABY6KJN3_9ARAC|nr:K02A2.6-like [Cordylochernes scorpioides]